MIECSTNHILTLRFIEHVLVCFLSVSVYRQSRVMKNLPVLCILFTIVLLHRSWFQCLFPRVVPSLKPFNAGSQIFTLLQGLSIKQPGVCKIISLLEICLRSDKSPFSLYRADPEQQILDLV